MLPFCAFWHAGQASLIIFSASSPMGVGASSYLFRSKSNRSLNITASIAGSNLARSTSCQTSCE